jgi:hypothetical protein
LTIRGLAKSIVDPASNPAATQQSGFNFIKK